MRTSKKLLTCIVFVLFFMQAYGVALADFSKTQKFVINTHEAMRVIHNNVFILQDKHDSNALKTAIHTWNEVRPEIKKLCSSMDTTVSRLDFLPFDVASLIAEKFKATSKKISSKFKILDGIFKKIDTKFSKNGKYIDSDIDELAAFFKKWSIVRHKAMDVDHLPVSNTSFKGLSFLKEAYFDKNSVKRNVPYAVSPEISKIAVTLDKKLDSINLWVFKNVRFQPYFGLLKGAVSTMREKSGNHADTASLITSLLRTSGFKTRYVLGSINYSEADLKKLLHFSGNSISNILTQTGLTYIDGALYTVWVQALSEGKWVNLLPDSRSNGDIAEVFRTSQELPNSFKYTVDLTIVHRGDKAISVASNIPSYYFSNKSASIRFRPKNEKERSIISAVYAMNSKVVREVLPFSFSSFLTIPSFLVDVSPEIKIGNRSFTPNVSLAMGEPVVLNLSIKLNNTVIGKCSHMIAAGGYASFRMDFSGSSLQKTSTKKANFSFVDFDTENAFDNTFPLTEDSLKALDSVSKDYSHENSNLTLTNLETHDKGLFFSPLFSENAVSISFRHFDIFDVPFLMVQSGVSIDVQKDAFFVSGKDKTAFIREKGGFGNMAEHRVLSRFCSGKNMPVSAFRIINRLAKKGVPIITLSSEKMFSEKIHELDYAVARDIKNALRHGANVTIPSSRQVAYIVTKGESTGYFLAGGKAGGLADSMKNLSENYKAAGESFQENGLSILGSGGAGGAGGVGGVGGVGGGGAGNDKSLAQKLNVGGTMNVGSNVNVAPKFPGGFLGMVLGVIIMVVLVIAIA